MTNGCYLWAQGFQMECPEFPECGHTDEPMVIAKDESKGELLPGQQRQFKSDNEVLDPKSTGRKRAKLLFPLDREAACEWQGKAFELYQDDYPQLKHDETFIGCDQGTQEAIHHGPSKDTLKNEVGNVWRICQRCHNFWHAKTDPMHPGDSHDFKPYVFRDATPEELAQRIMQPNAKAGERSIYPDD